MHFGARWFDGYLNRWNQPDTRLYRTIMILRPLTYAFVRNNPVNRIDPTGHMDVCPDCGDGGNFSSEEQLGQLRVLREEDRNRNSEVPFDSSLGGNLDGFKPSLVNDDIKNYDVNWRAVVGGGVLIVGGAVFSFIGLFMMGFSLSEAGTLVGAVTGLHGFAVGIVMGGVGVIAIIGGIKIIAESGILPINKPTSSTR